MMSQKRFEQALSGQSSTAKKVYDATPIEEYWSTHRVITQLARSNLVMSPAVVLASLDCLARSGLLQRSNDGWRRAPVKPAVEKKGLADLRELTLAATVGEPAGRTLEEPSTPATPYIPAQKETMTASNPCPVDVLGKISQRMNALAQAQEREREELSIRHRDELAMLAHEVADAAIDVQAALEAGSEEVAAARQLKALLNKIG